MACTLISSAALDFEDQNYCYKSMITLIPRHVGLALISQLVVNQDRWGLNQRVLSIKPGDHWAGVLQNAYHLYRKSQT